MNSMQSGNMSLTKPILDSYEAKGRGSLQPISLPLTQTNQSSNIQFKLAQAPQSPSTGGLE